MFVNLKIHASVNYVIQLFDLMSITLQYEQTFFIDIQWIIVELI
jgi:hypothetical protein